MKGKDFLIGEFIHLLSRDLFKMVHTMKIIHYKYLRMMAIFLKGTKNSQVYKTTFGSLTWWFEG